MLFYHGVKRAVLCRRYPECARISSNGGMNTYNLGGNIHGSHQSTEREAAEGSPPDPGRSRKAPVSASRSSRAPSLPRSTAASKRPSPSAACPTASAWKRSSPSTLPLSRRSRPCATAMSAAPSCTTCATASARQPRSARSCKHRSKREHPPKVGAFLFLHPVLYCKG